IRTKIVRFLPVLLCLVAPGPVTKGIEHSIQDNVSCLRFIQWLGCLKTPRCSKTVAYRVNQVGVGHPLNSPPKFRPWNRLTLICLSLYPDCHLRAEARALAPVGEKSAKH